MDLAIIAKNVTNPTKTKTSTNVIPHVMASVNSVKDRRIHRMRKARYIAKTAIVIVLTKTVSITTKMFARKFISVKGAIKLN